MARTIGGDGVGARVSDANAIGARSGVHISGTAIGDNGCH